MKNIKSEVVIRVKNWLNNVDEGTSFYANLIGLQLIDKLEHYFVVILMFEKGQIRMIVILFR